MSTYTIYNISTGEIRKAFAPGAEADINAYLREGEAYLNGTYAPSNYKVIDGEAVKIQISEEYDPEVLNRMNRRGLLPASDWTQLPDSPLSDSKKAEWATYRQALRDITTHSNWPNLEDADWPTPPT